MRPEPRLIRSPEEAEEVAATWLRYFGFVDARTTGKGSDGGVDVAGVGIVAQVKAEMKPAGRPVIQQIAGIAVVENATPAVFSLNGFTDEATSWASEAGVALFEFDLQGEPKPANAFAIEIVAALRVRRGPSEAMRFGPGPFNPSITDSFPFGGLSRPEFGRIEWGDDPVAQLAGFFEATTPDTNWQLEVILDPRWHPPPEYVWGIDRATSWRWRSTEPHQPPENIQHLWEQGLETSNYDIATVDGPVLSLTEFYEHDRPLIANDGYDIAFLGVQQWESTSPPAGWKIDNMLARLDESDLCLERTFSRREANDAAAAILAAAAHCGVSLPDCRYKFFHALPNGG